MANPPARVRTTLLLRRLFKANNLQSFLRQNQEAMQLPQFHQYINQLCKQRGLVPERVIKQAQIDRTYGHQLFNGSRRPSRDKVLQLAFGFGLDVEETQNLLRLAEKSPLYSRIPRDAVILYALAHKQDIFIAQESLAALGLTMLGGDWKHGK